MAHLDEIHDELKQSIAKAQEQYQKGADRHRLPAPPFQVGNKVFIKARFSKPPIHQRNCLRETWAHTKSLVPQAPTPSCYNFPLNYMLSTPCSTFPNSNWWY